MAEEDFQESEVMFPDHHYDKDAAVYLDHDRVSRNYNSDSTKRKMKKKKKIAAAAAAAGSLPVNIPRHHGGCGSEANESEEGEMEPPHVVTARRIGAKMAFSVCTGNGRTLKGRDLSQVRNSVLRMTGFLEA